MLSTRRTRGIAEEIKNDPKRNKMILKYSTEDGSHVVLEGINENKDFIYVVLDKANKNYLLTLSSARQANIRMIRGVFYLFSFSKT